MTDSDEEISISQNSKNHTGMRKLRLRNQVRIKLFHIILQLKRKSSPFCASIPRIVYKQKIWYTMIALHQAPEAPLYHLNY